MTVCGLLMGGHLSGWCFKSVILLLYMALISSVAYSVWGILLKANPVGKVAVYSFTNPIFSVLLSFVFLGYLAGVREGTVISAVIIGPIVRVFKKYLDGYVDLLI